ncbi:hypothetical protein [Thermococcus pacificus]|uniref:Uncharacterized protein n=1 Tax=Thermococcus pacificus TaxID=71998 RepID=A0A218P9U9_9EURY|nr:hypothetical protein [Thermococcus pacificus]ASJ07559.1 hypothetical protein A3L08_09625 [Thermococcus pacificus]
MTGRKALVVFVIALLLVASVFSTYSWWQCRKEKREILVDVYIGSQLSILALGEIGDLMEHQLQNNASKIVLLIYTMDYRDKAYEVGHTFLILYLHSDEDKFWKLSVAIRNLADFLSTALNGGPEECVHKLGENLETLKKFDALFKELRKYEDPFDIPAGLAEEFFNTSEQLKW